MANSDFCKDTNANFVKLQQRRPPSSPVAEGHGGGGRGSQGGQS